MDFFEVKIKLCADLLQIGQKQTPQFVEFKQPIISLICEHIRISWSPVPYSRLSGGDSLEEKVHFDPNGSEPLYKQLASHLREKIIRGEILPGEKLPSESEMLSFYNVGRLTIRNALSLLVSEGLLSKAQGRGTFCTGGKDVSRALDIEVLLDMTDAYFIPYYVHGISEVLSGSNSNFLISNTQDSDELICSLLENIAVKGSSGVILQYTGPKDAGKYVERLSRCLDLLLDRGLPVIILDGHVDNPRISCFTVDEFSGGHRAAEHLAAYGHRRCAVINLGIHRDSRLRCEGFKQGAGQFGMEEPLEVCAAETWEEDLIRAVRSGVTGIFAYNDNAAIRCILMLRKAGYRIPGDVSVIGFDDTYLASSSDPPLTCLAHPKETIGRDAAGLLLSMIRTGNTRPAGRTYPVDLTMRGSCGPRRESV